MKRKQIYLTDHLEHKLSELAASRGVPQSEVIREGLELYLQSFEDKEKDWNELIQQMKESPYRDLVWNRNDLYEERHRRTTNEE